MFARLGAASARFFQAATPDPFLLAIGLTAVTAALALVLTPTTAVGVLEAWQGPRGFFGLLGFSMQMCLVLVTGHALAMAPVVERLFERVAAWPRRAGAAGAMVAFIAMGFALLNWGLGLMVGALLARKVAESAARRGLALHYPWIAAAGYTGMLVWHGGLSGTAPLKVTTRADLLELLGPELGARVEPISIFETLLSPLNLVTSLGLLVLVPLVVYGLCPSPEASAPAPLPPAPEPAPEPGRAAPPGLAERLESSRWVTALFVLPLAAHLVRHLGTRGLAYIDLNFVNLSLLSLGLALHGRPRSYVRAVERAVSGCAGIILQFPLYGGIMGIMAESGLARLLAQAAISVSGPQTYALLTFLAAGLINFFVPSGGGQWAVQGPVAIEAAALLGLSPATAVMAVAYGDQWTNMLQPFWALPLLGLTGMRARDIMGYGAVLFLVAGAWFMASLLVFG